VLYDPQTKYQYDNREYQQYSCYGLENKCRKVLEVQAYNILLDPNSSTLQYNIQQLVLHLLLAPLLPPTACSSFCIKSLINQLYLIT